jgi:hypothetical protein
MSGFFSLAAVHWPIWASQSAQPAGRCPAPFLANGPPYGTATAVTSIVIGPSGSTIVAVHWISVPWRPVL